MAILVAVGVLNTGQTFPCAFSYCPSENTASYTFFWESLKAHLFNRADSSALNPTPPRVILGDQAAGLIALISQAFPDAII